jgi:hypothetical protein
LPQPAIKIAVATIAIARENLIQAQLRKATVLGSPRKAERQLGPTTQGVPLLFLFAIFIVLNGTFETKF